MEEDFNIELSFIYYQKLIEFVEEKGDLLPTSSLSPKTSFSLHCAPSTSPSASSPFLTPSAIADAPEAHQSASPRISFQGSSFSFFASTSITPIIPSPHLRSTPHSPSSFLLLATLIFQFSVIIGSSPSIGHFLHFNRHL